MRNQPIDLGTLTIDSAAQVSDALNIKGKCLRGLVIGAPAALTGTVTVAVSLDGGATFLTLYSGGLSIEIPADGCILLDSVGADQIRVESGSSEGAERVFIVKGIEDF